MSVALLILTLSVCGVSVNAVDKPLINSKAAQAQVTDIDKIVAAYNTAYEATTNPPKGNLHLSLDGRITGNGLTGFLLWAISPIARRTLAKTVITTDYIPGYAEILPSDVVEATSSSQNGVTTIRLKLKEQVDGINASAKDGPVGRGIGTLGNFSRAAEELGAEITEGGETISITYQDPTIKVTIDENTGAITGGTWQYSARLHIDKAKVNLKGISLTFKNVNAKFGYLVEI